MQLNGIFSAVLDWNRRVEVGTGAFVLGAFLVLFAFHVSSAWRKEGGLDYPPPLTDQPDYDSIGVQVWKGHGFCRDFGDSDFQAPYRRWSRRHVEWADAATAGFTGRYATTYRPPGLPAVIAATHLAFGRQFWAIRLVNAMAMAGASALVGGVCLRAAGLFPALTYLLLIVCNRELNEYSTDLLTESLAALCVGVMAFQMQSLSPRSAVKSAVWLGVVGGLSILVRNNFALWLPPLAALIAVLARSARLGMTFFATALIVALPWFVRNCLVLDAFMPLGAQGMIEMPAGFSDEAIEHHGNWHDIRGKGYYDFLLKKRPGDKIPRFDTETEARMARYGQAQAVAWMKSHPLRLLKLTLIKPLNEWRLYRPRDGIRVFLLFIGTLLFWDRNIGKIILGFAIIDSLAVAATWSVNGRFLVPIVPLVNAAASLGIWAIYVAIVEYRRPIVARLEAPPAPLEE